MAISSEKKAELEAELAIIKSEILKGYKSKEYGDGSGNNLVRTDLALLLKRRSQIERALKGSKLKEII